MTAPRSASPHPVLAALHQRLVVSCQPVAGGPLDDDGTVVRMAQAAVAGGAGALRIEDARRLALVRQAVQVPLVGIVKRDLPDSPVRITPWLQDVHDLAQAGADIIAVDATVRPRPVPVTALLQAIRSHQVLAMADASDDADAMAAWHAGFDLIGTTLSGYVAPPGTAASAWQVPDAPDIGLVQRLAAPGCRVMAEGRYDTPQRAAAALQAGAWAVTVGSAITRLEVVTGWFVTARACTGSADPPAPDLGVLTQQP
jgi:putative N-acetylmannosamine-6-phosphate epimerase